VGAELEAGVSATMQNYWMLAPTHWYHYSGLAYGECSTINAYAQSDLGRPDCGHVSDRVQEVSFAPADFGESE
jgi:hypothetical protein